MTTALSPLVSEFETTEQEESYLTWLKGKVQKSLADTRPNVSHDQVLFEMRALLQSSKPLYAAN